MYEIDPYLKECSAIVKSLNEIEGEKWLLLDQTIFYPEGGGQPADFGSINGEEVLDVQMFDNEILHKVNIDIEPGTRVKLAIDYERRFEHMQQHTGQHLLSAVWMELYHIPTVSFHLGKDSCTIDLKTSELTEEQMKAVETKVMDYVFENRSVEHYVLPFDEVEPEMLAKLKENPKFVRFIEIDGIDTSACCGTHVRMLGELGLLKLISWERYKQNVRLTFNFGKRAYVYFQEVFQGVTNVSKKLNIAPLQVTERFSLFYNGYQQLKKSYQKLYEKEVYHQAAELITNNGNVIEIMWEDRPLQELKDLAKIIIEKEEKVVIFHSQAQKSWIFAASSSQLFNVSSCIQLLKETYGGKGGGNSVFGQWIGDISESDWQNIKKQIL